MDGRVNSGSGRARSRCGARPGCMAKAKVTGIILQVRELNTAFRGTPCSLCFLRLVPNQRSNPKKCNPRLLRRQHIEGSENWAGARRREKKKKKGEGAPYQNDTIFGLHCWRVLRVAQKLA